MNKLNIFLWALYDFANSISNIVFFLYFSQWLVIDKGVADIWFNLIFVGSTILLLVTSPIFGTIADKTGVKMPFLRICTIFTVLGLVSTSLLANSPYLDGYIILTCIAYLVANYFYQFSFTFYNALLSDIAPPKFQGLISGIGQSANWTGQIAGLLITLPLAGGMVFILGSPGRSQTFLPGTIAFFLLCLPMLLFFKENSKAHLVKIDLLSEYRNYFKNFKELFRTPGLGKFLIGYFFFNDAMLTALSNFPIYLEKIFNVSDQTKSILLGGSLITSAIGALVVGFVSDKIGLKKSLIIILSSWIIVAFVMSIIDDFTFFSVFSIIVGFLFGATWTVTRAVMAHLAPTDRVNNAFSFYTLAERFSTFVGPFTWGLITLLLVNTGDFRYRVALGAMAGFILIGLLIVKGVNLDSKGDNN